MSYTQREDIHKPSAIVPTDYQYVAFNYIGGSDIGMVMALEQQRKALRAHMEKTGGVWSNHEHGGTCHVCGASALYLIIFYHAKTNSYIQTGEDCARKMEMSYVDMNLFRRAIADAREAVAGKKKAQALLADAGMDCAWELSQEIKFGRVGDMDPDFVQYEEKTIESIVDSVVKWGTLSLKQINYLGVLFDKIDNREKVAAERKAESEAAAPCPTGRINISGTVLSLKTEETNFGTQTRMLVKADEGYRVWGTRICNFEKGQKVQFTATVTPSKDDPKFGFFKRPYAKAVANG